MSKDEITMVQGSVITMPIKERQRYGCWSRSGYPAVDCIHIEHQIEVNPDGCYLLNKDALSTNYASADELMIIAAAQHIKHCRLFKRQHDGVYLFVKRDSLMAREGEAAGWEEI